MKYTLGYETLGVYPGELLPSLHSLSSFLPSVPVVELGFAVFSKGKKDARVES